ncbi:MAG TPA: 4-hydroxyacetophenone monooxygenase, partial [Acinetobacter radioresistens]|nr:4-hydroxyacetophenone monooxygenase [Acinetobacter radioresistens]
VLFMIESQIEHILQLIQLVEKTHTQAVVVKAEVQDQFNHRVQDMLRGTVWQSGCTSWYQQNGGKNFSLWPTYTWRYWLETRKVNPADYHFLGNSAISRAA